MVYIFIFLFFYAYIRYTYRSNVIQDPPILQFQLHHPQEGSIFGNECIIV